ncbi:MAG: LD-carboxypeptidase [Endomicrobiales bacterium]|nr:LD-carboxypeptidase [Endomicrobiales bacterium]
MSAINKRIYLITPSWLIKSKKNFFSGVRNLEKRGFAFLNKNFRTKLPGPKQKARQIRDAFLSKSADIIMAQRGGYSALKTLRYLDFNIIRKHPKVFAGFSDLSALLNPISERCKTVTLHSPMLINFSAGSSFTMNSFLNAVNGFPEKNLFKGSAVKAYRHGTATGTLRGGNLVTLTSLIGTEWETRTGGAVLFLEDVDEEPHRVDRYLTQWILKGKLAGLKGLILGDFRGVKPRQVFNIISSQMKVGFPAVYCPNIGHVKNKLTLPVGAKVTLNTHDKTLTIKQKHPLSNRRNVRN